MSVPSASNLGSYPLPSSPRSSSSDLSSPAPPYSELPLGNEQTIPNQPDSFSPPPYAAKTNEPPIAGPNAGAPQARLGMFGLILAAAAGIPGYFAGKNLWKSHSVAGGIIGGIATAIAGFVGLSYFAQKGSKQ
jgi:hypothetical protein